MAQTSQIFAFSARIGRRKAMRLLQMTVGCACVSVCVCVSVCLCVCLSHSAPAQFGTDRAQILQECSLRSKMKNKIPFFEIAHMYVCMYACTKCAKVARSDRGFPTSRLALIIGIDGFYWTYVCMYVRLCVCMYVCTYICAKVARSE